MAKFVYFSCNQGSAGYLKEEIKRKHPYLNVAFSRQDFLTFKRTDNKDCSLDFESQCIFARSFGISLGKAKKEEISRVLQSELKHLKNEKFILHDWDLLNTPSQDQRTELLHHFSFHEGTLPKIGDYIIEIIKMNENDFFLGLRRYSKWQTPFVGGIPDFSLPDEAPSRAWLKTEEAIRLTQAEFKPNEIILEFGSAPGGSVYNLLERGLKVYGVDTGAMAAVCLKHPNYTHFQATMQNFEKEKIKGKVKWITLDINQKPSYTLRELRKIIPLFEKDLKGLFLTFKLTDPNSIKRLDANLNELKTYKLEVMATQLYHNRNEIFIYAVSSA